MPSQWSIVMVKVVPLGFQLCLVPLTCWFPKGGMKGDFSEIWLTTYFGFRNFANISAMRLIFFKNYSSLKIDFKNVEKNWENIFCFWDNCSWIGCLKLSLLGGEYWSSKVNMLRSSLRNSNITKRDFLRIICLHSDQEIW